MRFQPKSEEQVSRLFEKGDYPFTVISATEKDSKNGNPMIELHLQLDHTSIPGKTGFTKCYLLTDNPNFDFLLRHFCYSVGLSKDYEEGNLAPFKLKGLSGIARIGVEIDKTGTYPDKNRVLDFIEKSEYHINEELNDDIPFN